MFQKPKVPDRQILQKVTVQLPARGIRPPCNVRVSVHDGTVTLAGKIEFEMQRKAAIHAASGVNGVLRVVDQLTVMRNTIGGWHSNKPQAHTVRLSPKPSHPQPPAVSTEASGEAESQATGDSSTDASAKPLSQAKPYG